MLDIVSSAQKGVGRRPGKIIFGLPHKQQNLAAALPMVDVALSGGRSLRCGALALPVEQVFIDRIIMVHRGGGIIFIRFVQRYKEHIHLLIGKVPHTDTRHSAKVVIIQRGDNLLHRVGTMYIQRAIKSQIHRLVKKIDGIKPKLQQFLQQDRTVGETVQMAQNFLVLPTFGCFSPDGNIKHLLDYARLYEKLLTCKSGLGNQKLDDCLYRMKRLEIAVTRPFLMEVLRLNQRGKLTTDEVLRVFLMTENYLFRRNICEVATSALNKIFLNLNREILRYDGTADRYLDKMAYALLPKRDSGRFPDDEEFSAALSSKQVYLMRGKYKDYLFERFENYGTVEVKDVFRSLDNNTYTIEHIMPQHLTPEWIRDLGPNYEKIHAEWQHRLANLTLSGYNPNLSNNTFAEKRDAIPGGYRDSGLRMNQRLANETCWGVAELQKRNDEMVERASEIWAYPTTSFQPVQRPVESCTLDDEDVDLTGRDIQKYSYAGAEQPVTSWTEMFENMVRFLHRQDKSVLYGLADSGSTAELSHYVSAKPEELRSALQMDEHLYVEKNTSTAAKLSILCRLFPLYQADAGDLVFFLRDAENDKATQSTRFQTRLAYWTQALPIIQQQNLRWGIFNNVNPGTANTISGYFGIRGFHISCIANYDSAKVLFWLGDTDVAKNKEAFDRLLEHKVEIEQQLGCALEWDRSDDSKASSVGYTLPGVSISQEKDWPVMAKFHAQWSERICSVLLPYLEDMLTVSIHRMNVAGLLREWCLTHEEVQLHLDRSISL